MESEPSFLQRHGFVIAGVGLPVLLVVALLVVRVVPHYLVDDPRYDVVYSLDGEYDGSSDRRTQEVVVEHGELVVRWKLLDELGYQPRRRVFRANVVEGTVIELRVPEPEVDELEAAGGSLEFALEDLEGVRLDEQTVSPDGYSFSSVYSGGGGLFGELFYRSSSGLRTRIEKDGRALDVPRIATRSYWGQVYFLGWVVSEDAER